MHPPPTTGAAVLRNVAPNERDPAFRQAEAGLARESLENKAALCPFLPLQALPSLPASQSVRTWTATEPQSLIQATVNLEELQ